MSKLTAQIEADRRLLAFSSYEEYLDSLTVPQDICFLQSLQLSRTLAELGYRSTGETLGRAEFKRRLNAVLAYLYPSYQSFELARDVLTTGDPLQVELALREKANRDGKISTIVFLRYLSLSGSEISGYIDFAERMKDDDFKAFFSHSKLILPLPTDLGYYNWRTGKSMSNDSINYKVMVDPVRGVLFQNRFDRKLVCVNPNAPLGDLTTKKRITSNLYDHVVLFDHSLRQPI